MGKRKGERTTADDLFSNNPLKVGDHVLLGGTHASLPGTWYLGKVLWLGDEDILLERYTQNGQCYRQLDTIYAVRASGSLSDLNKLQANARVAVKELTDTIHEAERALGSARDALHNKLADLANGDLKIIPWDREANDACDQDQLAVAEKLDEEQVRL